MFDGILPKTLPESGNLWFVHTEDPVYAAATDEVEHTMLTVTESEVSDYVDVTRIGVNAVSVYDLPSWGSGFLTTGDQCGGYYGVYDGHKVVVTGFDLHETDFGLTPEFPVLVSGICDYLLGGNLVNASHYMTGENILIAGSTTGKAIRLRLPDQTTKTFDAKEAFGTYVRMTEPGFYRISQKVNRQTNAQEFVVDYPTERESDVDSAESMEAAKTGGGVARRGGVFELRNTLILLLLLLLLAEWGFFLRVR